MNLLLDLAGVLVFFGTLAAIFEAEALIRRRLTGEETHKED